MTPETPSVIPANIAAITLGTLISQIMMLVGPSFPWSTTSTKDPMLILVGPKKTPEKIPKTKRIHNPPKIRVRLFRIEL
tara:strand:- start:2753 stop:2989 length:237 start_codon:yes stop_codon:yes gene_type:complete